jgi:hypothetical protein
MGIFSKRKGQYLTVEYMLFFGIGISMVVAVFFLFSNMTETVKETSLEGQLERTGEMIRGTIINNFEVAQSTQSTINYNLSIPTKLSGCIYNIEVRNNQLNLNCTDNYKIGSVLSLYGINSKNENIIYSSKGIIEIKTQGTEVVLK